MSIFGIKIAEDFNKQKFKKKDLREATGISSASMAKLEKMKISQPMF